MKERPTLFSAPMVNAILRGGKTQTRRIVKITDNGHIKEPGGHRRWHPDDSNAILGSPFGLIGDRLWVRETFADLTKYFGHKWERKNPNTGFYERGRHPFFWYRADGDIPDPFSSPIDAPWKPSIHMPRHASRITL